MTHRQKAVDEATKKILGAVYSEPDAEKSHRELRKALYKLYDAGYDKKTQEVNRDEWKEWYGNF